MIPTSFRMAWRSLKRFKIPYFISFTGLLMAIVIFLLIGRYVGFHLTMDGFHRDADRIYRLNTGIELPTQSTLYAATSFAVGPDLSREIPEIAEVVRLRAMPTSVRYEDLLFDEGIVTYVDSTFFQMFSFDLLEGDPQTCLRGKEGIVLTRDLAAKYFGEESALNRLLKINVAGQERILKVSGVVANPPENSTLDFSMLANMELISGVFRPGYASLVPGLFTYFKLMPGMSEDNLVDQLGYFVTRKVPSDLQPVMSFVPVKLKDTYFLQGYQFDLGRKANRKLIYALFLLALLTLVIAIINYINISTALGTKRARQSAVKRVLGASVSQLVRSNLVETFNLVAMAGMTALLIFYLSKHQVDIWLDIEDVRDWLTPFQTLCLMLALIVLVSVVSGWYPALVLTRVRLTDILRSHNRFFNRHFDFKKVLLGFQFSISVFFLLTAWIIYSQLKFVQDKYPGFNRENIILVDVAGPAQREKVPALKNSFKEIAGVQSVSASLSPVYGMHTQANFTVPADSTVAGFLSDINYVDADFLQTYQTHLLAGRNFSDENNSDVENAFIINEQAARQLGLDPLNEAVGTEIQKIALDTITARIVGVVADYHTQSLHQKITPLIWQISSASPVNTMAVRMDGNTREMLDQMEDKWKEILPGEAFDYAFLDTLMANAYRSASQMNLFIRIMTVILLLITATGMYGMMLFIIEQKKPEIGIRKIIGASVTQIQVHLYGQYSGILLSGLVIGSLFGVYLLRIWLEGFAYRINLGIYPVLQTGFIGIILAFSTIYWLTRKAALLNPVEILKEE